MREHRRTRPVPRSLPPARQALPAVTAGRADPVPTFGRETVSDAHAGLSAASLEPTSPYLDYGRFLTPAGGVLIIYKDLDLRLRHTLWRLLAWSSATGYASWFLRYSSPVHATWINVLCCVAIALLNWLIVAKPIEIYRRLEIRPDCLILEGAEVFWHERMEGGLPTLQPDEDGNLILCGVYGTRFVE